LLRAAVRHSAGCAQASPFTGLDAVAFVRENILGIRDRNFSELNPAAHRIARLRIAESVTESVARLAAGWSGFTLPYGTFTRRTTNRISFDLSHVLLLPDQPCLVALSPVFRVALGFPDDRDLFFQDCSSRV
jgi:hypothetical protein